MTITWAAREGERVAPSRRELEGALSQRCIVTYLSLMEIGEIKRMLEVYPHCEEERLDQPVLRVLWAMIIAESDIGSVTKIWEGVDTCLRSIIPPPLCSYGRRDVWSPSTKFRIIADIVETMRARDKIIIEAWVASIRLLDIVTHSVWLSEEHSQLETMMAKAVLLRSMRMLCWDFNTHGLRLDQLYEDMFNTSDPVVIAHMGDWLQIGDARGRATAPDTFLDMILTSLSDHGNRLTLDSTLPSYRFHPAPGEPGGVCPSGRSVGMKAVVSAPTLEVLGTPFTAPSVLEGAIFLRLTRGVHICAKTTTYLEVVEDQGLRHPTIKGMVGLFPIISRALECAWFRDMWEPFREAYLHDLDMLWISARSAIDIRNDIYAEWKKWELRLTDGLETSECEGMDTMRHRFAVEIGVSTMVGSVNTWNKVAMEMVGWIKKTKREISHNLTPWFLGHGLCTIVARLLREQRIIQYEKVYAGRACIARVYGSPGTATKGINADQFRTFILEISTMGCVEVKDYFRTLIEVYERAVSQKRDRHPVLSNEDARVLWMQVINTFTPDWRQEKPDEAPRAPLPPQLTRITEEEGFTQQGRAHRQGGN